MSALDQKSSGSNLVPIVKELAFSLVSPYPIRYCGCGGFYIDKVIAEGENLQALSGLYRPSITSL